MNDIETLSASKTITHQYPFYRADVFMAHLIEQGYDPQQIVILRKDGMGVGFLHDIESITLRYPNLTPEYPYLEIVSGRHGIYDALPEDVFYTPDHSHKEKDRKTIIHRFRKNREIEGFARRFMRIFESESDMVLSFLQLKHLRYDKIYAHRDSSDIFSSYWHVISLMSEAEVHRFLKIVPYISRIRGNMVEIATVISFILHVKIEIQKIWTFLRYEESLPPLFEMFLEDNSVLSPDIIDYPEQIVLLTISDLSLTQCKEFFEGKKKYEILQFLFELFFDMSTPLQIELKPKIEFQYFTFFNSDNEPYLGVNTYL